MADYSSNARSLIFGLSDFWTQYFKEVDQIDFLYKGAEIQIGQVYLDLLSLLLNNSIQDTTIFNKEFFKLITIREDELQFVAGATPSDNSFQYVLPDGVVEALYLNNKILEPTQSLEKTIDYVIGDTGTDNRLDFKFDPTNAYKERVFGSAISQFKLRAKLLGPEAELIRVFLNDVGGAIAITRTDFDITISYDGPLNTASTTASEIVAAVNTNIEVNGIVLADLLDPVGNGSPDGTGGLVELLKAEFNTLDGYAARQVVQAFGGTLTVNTITDWVAEGVEKGDILRLISGPGVGAPQEFDIDLVRKPALYVNAGTPILEISDRNLNFAVLREPANNTSLNEAFNNSGIITDTGADGSINAIARRFSTPTGNFQPYHAEDVLNVTSGDNISAYRIVEVISPTTIVLNATGLVNEFTGSIDWELHTVTDAVQNGLTATLAAAVDGVSLVTTDLIGPFTNDVIGGVLKILNGSNLSKFDIIAHGISGPNGTLTVSNPEGSGPTILDEWAVAKLRTSSNQLLFSPPVAWPRAAELQVRARRLLDNRVVQDGIDYEFTPDTGIIRPITVWATALNNTVTYTYALAIVENTTPLQSGLDGSVVSGSPNTFTSPTGPFTDAHVGYAIRIRNSSLIAGPTNNGVHVIANVLSSTTVELTEDKVVPTTLDANNGTLVWSLLRRGVTGLSTSASVNEIAFWAPDILVDRFHLFNTYGYLINKFERSSESYRSLIRGIFQLFMLGPTLERFESAVNTVAGLDVIRDDGELLLNYQSGALDSGSDGFLDLTTANFSSASTTFTVGDVGKSIFVLDGNNANARFDIVALVDANNVTLASPPVSDGPVNWELVVATTPQVVTTSAREYEFDRRIPLRDAVTDPANFGIKTFQAFEVLTEVFEVTDDVETPGWWEFSQIPEVLWENQTSERRQSTANVFENVLNPSDGGLVGDPGFVIGADDDGFEIPDIVLPGGGGDGVVIGDPFSPVTNDVFFEDTVASNFTVNDIGNIIRVDALGAERQPRILAFVSPSRVQIEGDSFLGFTGTTSPPVSWDLLAGTVPRRHKAAFVILDRWLKHNIFSVSFDSSLLAAVSAELLTDLQELVFVAKPTYTYLILSPTALFDEIINVTEEDITFDTTISLGGDAGEIIAANESNLNIIGESWRIGGWFRHVSDTNTFAAPAASLPDATGVPDAGYLHKINRFVYDTTDFTSGGDPIQITERVSKQVLLSNDGEITLSGTEIHINSATGGFILEHTLGRLIISGSGAGNDGNYGIGQVLSGTEAVLSATGLSAESGLTIRIRLTGGFQGLLTNDAVKAGFNANQTGLAFFRDVAANGIIESSDNDTIVRRPFLGGTHGDPLNPKGFVAIKSPNATDRAVAYSFYERRVEPLEADPDATGNISAGVLTVPVGTLIFDEKMGRLEEHPSVNPLATPPYNLYEVVFTGGANAGTTSTIREVLSAREVVLQSPIPVDENGAQYYITHSQTPVVNEECGDWEYLTRQIVIDGNTVDFSNTPSQDAAVVSYTAYGVREPIDPSLEVFDDSSGDTLYSIGMPDPAQKEGRSRTGLDVDMREEPLQITRT